MQKIIIFLVVLSSIAGIAYWQFFYPPHILKNQTEAALEQFADRVATKDRTKIGEALNDLLADDAKITLGVSFFSITRQNPAVVQNFDKANFIHFIDTVLYPMTDYAYEPVLETFELADDRQSAAVMFSSKEWADGNNYYAGTQVAMRFSSIDTKCTGQVAFADKKASLREADCTLTLMMVPKPGEAEKIKGDVLKDYLMK
jgi:hypothetical protein